MPEALSLLLGIFMFSDVENQNPLKYKAQCGNDKNKEILVMNGSRKIQSGACMTS